MLQEELFEDGIRLEVDPDVKVAVVTIDRPPVNPTRRNETVLLETFRDIDQRRDVNCVILPGAGKRAFCAGRDLSQRTSSLLATIPSPRCACTSTRAAAGAKPRARS